MFVISYKWYMFSSYELWWSCQAQFITLACCVWSLSLLSCSFLIWKLHLLICVCLSCTLLLSCQAHSAWQAHPFICYFRIRLQWHPYTLHVYAIHVHTWYAMRSTSMIGVYIHHTLYSALSSHGISFIKSPKHRTSIPCTLVYASLYTLIHISD